MLYIIGQDGSIAEVSRTGVILALLLVLAVVITFYVLRSLGLYKLAKKYSLKTPALAWFPFTWIYVAATLVGDAAIFGRPFKKFALTAFIVFTVSTALYAALRILVYFPVVGFYLQGGETYFASYESQLINCDARFGISAGYLGLIGFNDPYSAGFWSALSIAHYVIRIFNLASLFITVIVYSNFFRSFLPNHYFVATIFSVFGFFGPFAFVVRNNDRISYADYARSRYSAFTGGGYGGYGGSSGADGYRAEKPDIPDPFDDESEKKDKKDDDPFGDF